MIYSHWIWIWAAATLLALPISTALLAPDVPVPFDWGSFSSSGHSTYGVYDDDNVTTLQTGDLALLIWAGADGRIDPPNPDGSPGGDDMMLDTNTIQNGAPLPPPARDRGYIPFKTFTYDSAGPLNNAVVFIRAWNASEPSRATAFGDSSTALLLAGATFNAARWNTNVTWPVEPVATATPTATSTPSPSPTATATSTSSPTRTSTATSAPSATTTATHSATPTSTPTATATATHTASPTMTAAPTATVMVTVSPTTTYTPTSTATAPPTMREQFLPLILRAYARLGST